VAGGPSPIRELALTATLSRGAAEGLEDRRAKPLCRTAGEGGTQREALGG